MLRRNPTRITLTTEDITLYEENRDREEKEREAHLRHEEELLARQHQQQNSSSPAQSRKGTDQNSRHPMDAPSAALSDKARILGTRTREDRLGLGIGGVGSSRG